ncbi:MAG: hypothetical protein ACKV2T_44010 [Kofleriaceae bacterium]
MGFLELGPTLALELGGRSTSLQARLRAIEAGALSYVIIAGSGKRLSSGWGIAAAFRRYTAVHGNMRGFYWGLAIEGVQTQVYTTRNAVWLLKTTLAVPTVEVGYRWAYGSFFIELGGAIGYAFVVGREAIDLNNEGNESNNAHDAPGLLGTGGVGMFF